MTTPLTERPILVVDDDSDIRESLKEILEGEGYLVACAGHGLEALGYLQSAGSPPALILLDVMMPVMNGIQFRLEQKKNVLWSKIPVIVMSATDKEELGSKLDLDGVDYLAKPLRLAALLELLSARLG